MSTPKWIGNASQREKDLATKILEFLHDHGALVEGLGSDYDRIEAGVAQLIMDFVDAE